MTGFDLSDITVGDALPVRDHTATNVSLFLYNAAIWNPHRIHYDERYTIDVENHPAVVIDGPLQGDWLSQVAANWIGEHGRVIQFGYSNRSAAYLGETVTSGGSVKAINTDDKTIELELFIKNKNGDIITPGSATVALEP
jgi:3-methylfumaryl-CoA hydratase